MIPEYLKAEIDQDTNKMIDEQRQIEEKLYTIKLKVHFGEEVKELSIRKDKKLADLCTLALETFEVKDL